MNILNINSNLKPKEESTGGSYKDNLFVPQNMNQKEPLSFGIKDSPFLNHLQSKHNLSMKESPIDMHKEQIINMNHSNFMSSTNEIKPEPPFGYQNPPLPQVQAEKNTAGITLL